MTDALTRPAARLADMAFRRPGDEVVVPVPAGAHHRACIRLAGATHGAVAALRELARTDKIDVAPPDGAFYLYLSCHPDTAEPMSWPGAARGTARRDCPIEDVTEGLRRIVNLVEKGTTR